MLLLSNDPSFLQSQTPDCLILPCLKASVKFLSSHNILSREIEPNNHSLVFNADQNDSLSYDAEALSSKLFLLFSSRCASTSESLQGLIGATVLAYVYFILDEANFRNIQVPTEIDKAITSFTSQFTFEELADTYSNSLLALQSNQLEYKVYKNSFHKKILIEFYEDHKDNFIYTSRPVPRFLTDKFNEDVRSN